MPKLEFLADMNISPLTVEQLRRIDWNIVRVSEVLSSKAKDTDILTYALNFNKVIITQDLDFSMLLALRGHRKPSVISLRLENVKPEVVTRHIIDAVSVMEKELEEGVILTVDEASVRYRSLPITLT